MPLQKISVGALPRNLYPAPTQPIDNDGISVPFRISKSFTAADTSLTIFNANAPYAFRITGVSVHVTTKAAQTATVKKGANSVTDAISLNPTNVNSIVPAGTLNPTYQSIAQNGSLSVALSAAGAAGTVYIDAIKV